MNDDGDREGVQPPRKNPHLVGHAAAETVLWDAWNAGRLHHAWMITGPRGIGKATLAFRFARFILAHGDHGRNLGEPTPQSLHLDPDDPIFRRIASGGHADLATIERTINPDNGRLRTEIVVSDVRRAGGFLNLTSAEGGWRVIIVDAADEMNRNAANALLKILEEPPPRAILLLVANAPGRLPPTIRSRCRRLVLEPLESATMEELLVRYRPDLAADDRAALAILAEGSIGRALSLAGEGGLELYYEMIGILDGLPGLDIPRLHRFADRLGRPGAEDAFRTATELLSSWLVQLVRQAVPGAPSGSQEILDLGFKTVQQPIPGETGSMARLAGLAGLDQWVEVWEKTSRLAALASGLNLERKQLVLVAFLAIDNAASA